MNALTRGVPEGIAEAIAAMEKDPSVAAAVLIGAGSSFIAGADINEFPKMVSGEKNPADGFLPLMLQIEDCTKPVVAAIHGNALGAGLETAMACHYRVAVPSAKVGQPEVALGIHSRSGRDAASAPVGGRSKSPGDVYGRKAGQGLRSA